MLLLGSAGCCCFSSFTFSRPCNRMHLAKTLREMSHTPGYPPHRYGRLPRLFPFAFLFLVCKRLPYRAHYSFPY
uniref:Putative secreted protein n=1 Tax=Anopheles marajoara TaxID=58244 RepID=A0A2M4CDF7_9DIPT